MVFFYCYQVWHEYTNFALQDNTELLDYILVLVQPFASFQLSYLKRFKYLKLIDEIKLSFWVVEELAIFKPIHIIFDHDLLVREIRWVLHVGFFNSFFSIFPILEFIRCFVYVASSQVELHVRYKHLLDHLLLQDICLAEEMGH